MLKNIQSRALLAQTFEFSKRVVSSRWESDKGDKAKQRKMMYLEDKMLFGDLLETKREKLRRSKLEASGQIPKAKHSNLDSECTWILNSSPSNVKILKGRPEPKNTQPIEEISTCTQTNCDIKSVTSSEPNVKSETTPQATAKSKTSKMKKPSSKLKGVTSLSSALQFPVFVSKATNDSTRPDEILKVTAPDKEYKKFPSVTKILTETMSEESKMVLEKWKASMIEKFGIRGFDLYQKELFEEGRLLHAAIVNNLVNKSTEVPDKIKKPFNSLTGVFSLIEDVHAVESYVVHQELKYKGIFDCVAYYGGDLCLIDWKKSDRAKNSIGATYDAPVQVAAYIGALNTDLKYSFQIKKGLIVVAYTNGDSATIHEIGEDAVEKYWKIWLERLGNYQATSAEAMN
ncbi:hypothetical protein QAD02_023583 [Eretmocerus hayati]|uniref:Uncharacterized protein n=1 Tax=Eretmocerus hayati TaxID=131215 RepID=A0ACC2PW09_9HYME|nr:hypothetical protein QAD02_023583 [Eretmocerus hayati]